MRLSLLRGRAGRASSLQQGFGHTHLNCGRSVFPCKRVVVFLPVSYIFWESFEIHMLVFPSPFSPPLELGGSYAPWSRHNVSCHWLPYGMCFTSPGWTSPTQLGGRNSVYPSVYAIMRQAIGHPGTCLPPLYNAMPPSFRYFPAATSLHYTLPLPRPFHGGTAMDFRV